jgi:hypothetical protein
MKKSLLFFCLFSLFVQGIFSQELNWRNLILDSETNFYQVQESFQNEWRNIERPYPKGKGFMAYKRWEWYMEPRVFPTGKRIPTNAIQLAKQENPAMFPPPSGTSGLWTYIGNSSVPGGGGGAGRVNAIRPQPGSSTIFYACAPAGGLWKTTDAGASWNVMNTDYLDAIGATDVAIDPSNSNIIYLATGDGDAGDTYSIGILKSTDGGTTWAATGLNWNVTQGRMINRLLIHPTNSNILLAATSLGVYKSINAGASWVLATSGSFKDMEFKPSDPTVVYAAGTTFFKSIDTGSTFSSITSGVPSTDVGRLSIAVSEANASIVYLLASKNSDSGFLGVYKSTNSGTSFTTTATTPNLLGWNSNGGDAGGQGWYDLAIECSATDANMLWVGGVNVWKSTNGGTSWACNAHWTGSGGLPYVHADVHCLSWIPANNSLYVGCDGGVFRSTNNGTSYSDVSSNLQISQQYRLGVAQLNGNKILTGWQDNGSNLKNGTAHSQVLGGDGMECIIARTNDNVMYGEIYYGAIYKSTNNGGTFNPIVNSGGTGVNADGAWVTPYAMGATDNDLYVGKSTIYKSSNAGTSFTAMGTFGTGVVNAFAVAVSNVNVIYASKGSALYKTTNASAFSAISGLPNLYITSIAVSSIDENKVWVTFSGYSAGSKVYYSSNGGTSWTNISGSLPNIPSNTIVFQNTGSDALYVGTDAGVYYKDNSLADWIPYMNGLPNVVVDELEIHAATNTITAATYGRGTWRAPLYSQPNLDLAVVSITSPNGNFCSTTVTPELTVMNAGINAITSFQLTYTISGQASQNYSWSGNLTSGNSVLVTLPVSTVSAGSYTLTINASSINGGSDDNAANNSSSSIFTIVSGAANDICSNSTNLVINAAYLTANNTVTCSDSADPNCGGSGIKDVWYKFTFTGGDITIQTNSGSLVDTRIAIYSDCTDPFAIACNDDISTTNYNSRINLTCAQLTNGATYYIQAGGYAGGTGTFGIQVLSTVVAGCTNVFACNYNECANTDNGSCINATTWYLDADADGYYVSSTSACTSPGVTYTSTQGIIGDCNDASASVNAAGVEICGNGIDEDCSGADLACAVPGCTDNTACNYNASATVSNGSCTFASTWYLDTDADGYYVSSTSACSSPGATYTSTQGINGDCNDANASVNAAGVEVCGNGIDEDCSGADLACAVPGCTDNTACNYNASATVSNGSCTFASTWYLDADADGYYVSSTSACTSPGATYTATQGINGDCNDASASVNAAGVEICGNGIDEDCSGADLACAIPGCMDNTACNYNASATVSNGSCTFASTWYLDADADGYYVSSTSACSSPGATYTLTQGINGDCNDASASVNAAGVEICGNGIDEDCSGTDLACAVPGCIDNTACNYNASATVSNGSCTFASTWYLDADADGYYVSSTSACSSPGATYTLTQGINGDCNDASASVNAGIGESCSNNIDDNCNSLINEGCNETDVAGDIFTTPINITASFYPLCNLASGNLTGMGASPFGQINCITGEDLWYQFTAQTEGVSIQLNTTAFDGVIEIHNTNGELIASENSNASIGNEVLNFVGLTSGSVYRVGIRNYNSNLGTGNFTCCVRQLKRGACAYGPGPYQLCQIFKAQYVLGASYRFVFSGISGIANGINYTKASTSDLLVLNAVVPTLPYGSNYNVLITNIYSLSNGIGQIEIIEVPALSSCPMNTIAEPNTQLGTSFRCSNGQQFRGAIVNSQPWICGVTNWKWKFQEVDANNMAIGLPIEHLRGAASNFLNLNQIIQLQYGKKYAVQTAPVFSYGTGNYGTTQYLCIVGSAGVQSFENEYKSLEESIQQTIYPNPYDNGPLTIESNKFDKDSKVDVFIFNAQQQLIRNKQAAIVAKKITLNGLEELENGIYFLVIQSSNSKEMVKLLVIH